MAFPIPSLLLKQLYTFGSLKIEKGVRFSLKNRLSDATITDLRSVSIDGKRVPIEAITLDLDDGTMLRPEDPSEARSTFRCAASSISLRDRSAA